jgi:perosamine synthetase
MQIPFGKPMIGDEEIAAVTAVLRSGMLVHGAQTHAFEQAFAERVGVRHAIAVSSCTAGLHLALFVRGIGPGHRVVVPAMTHVATAHVVELQGATPVFVDVDPRTGNLDVNALAAVADDGIDAILPVHYLGLPCDMDAITAIAERTGAMVIEDCALAVGATYGQRNAGGLGDCGSFSFYPVKHLTSIEGGMVTTDDDGLAEQIRKRRAFGYNRDLSQRTRPGVYDVDALGYNYRMNEVEAAVGVVQLRRVDEWLVQRAQNHAVIAAAVDGFSDITVFPSEYGSARSSHYCFNLVLPEDGSIDRDAVQDALSERGIGTSIHYPSAVPMYAYYREKYGYRSGQFPIAEWLGSQTLSLPVGPHLGTDGATRVAEATVAALEQAGA